MPPSALLGEPTVERHEHFDADGNPTGHTVVTRESGWTEADRDTAYALWHEEQERCPQCGGPRDECAEPIPLYPQRHTCWRTAGLSVVRRKWESLHKDDKPGFDGYMPTDGVRLWMSTDDLTPDDDFLTDQAGQSPNWLNR